MHAALWVDVSKQGDMGLHQMHEVNLYAYSNIQTGVHKDSDKDHLQWQ